eukprot:gene18103-18343_t
MQYQTPSLPHLLVVDDDNRIRTLLVKFLSDQGFRVNAAANAAEARSHMACHVFDALILDIMMPGEDGIQLTKSLRATTRVPILLLTARDQLDDKVTGFDIGADDYLTKPFEPLELLARLKLWLKVPVTPFQGMNWPSELDTGFGQFGAWQRLLTGSAEEGRASISSQKARQREMMSAKKPEVENQWETHASKIKEAMTKAIDHTASIANVVVKSHRDIHGRMQDRFAEGMDHLKDSASKYKN